MPQPFNLRITMDSSGDEVCLQGEFSDDEWVNLIRFADFAEQLNQSRVFHSGMQLTYSLRWNAQDGLSHESTLPPEDDIAAFLHRMRPFVLQDEPTSFFRVFSTLSRQLNHPQFHAAIERQKRLFSGKAFQSQVEIVANDVVLNADATLTKWLNAFEYHRDVQKREELEALHQLLPLESSRAIFLDMMFDKAKAIFEIARLIRAFEKRHGKELAVRIGKKGKG